MEYYCRRHLDDAVQREFASPCSPVELLLGWREGDGEGVWCAHPADYLWQALSLSVASLMVCPPFAHPAMAHRASLPRKLPQLAACPTLEQELTIPSAGHQLDSFRPLVHALKHFCRPRTALELHDRPGAHHAVRSTSAPEDAMQANVDYLIDRSAVITTFLRLVIPTSLTLVPTDPDNTPQTSSLILAAIVAALQLLAFYLSGTTQKCAPLGKYEPPISVDALTVTNGNGKAPTTKPVLKDITQFATCSPISYVLFGWMSPVLALGATLESLSQDDLPALAANDRAPNVWEKMKKSETFKKGPKWANGLLWRLLLVNKNLFAWRELRLGRMGREEGTLT